jgi:hypothetical protein
MGLFTGVSLVTFVEVAYWLLRLITVSLFGEGSQATESRKNSVCTNEFYNSLAFNKSKKNNFTEDATLPGKWDQNQHVWR